MNEIDENKVSMFIKRLKHKFSCGLDRILNSLIRNSSDVLSKPLTLTLELMDAVLTIFSVSLRLIVIYRMPPPK